MNAFQRLFRGQTRFEFASRWRRWFAISGIVILVGVASLGIRGLNFSIDFKGGTVWDVPTTASVSQVRTAIGGISSDMDQATITSLTNRLNGKREIEVKAPAKETANSTEVSKVTQKLADLAHVNTNEVQLNDIGPSWGSDITHKAVEAVIVFLVIVTGYIWIRFEGKMAAAALVALVHDILVTVGIYSLSGFQVSPDTVIAFLTILGYSLYDTIVVFDKVQENTKALASSGRNTYSETVNLSMNQVLARSINTSFVAIIPVLSILVVGAGILGASALEDFGLALFIGLATGAYSSIFIASPLVALLKEREPRFAQIRERKANRPPSKATTPAEAARARRASTAARSSTSGRGNGGGGDGVVLGKETESGAEVVAGSRAGRSGGPTGPSAPNRPPRPNRVRSGERPGGPPPRTRPAAEVGDAPSDEADPDSSGGGDAGPSRPAVPPRKDPAPRPRKKRRR